MRFKNLLIANALFAMATVTVGCEKVVEQSPLTAFTDASVFTNSDRALLALNGVYDAAQSGTQTLAGRGYPFGAGTIEQGDNRGEDVVNLATFYQITYQGTYDPSTANNQAMWDNNYNLINKANIAIDGFNKVGTSGVLPAATATQYIAECRFLRALAHHELLMHFARPYLDGNGTAMGVPFRDYAVTGSAALDKLKTEPRPTVAADYTKILEDLAFAEANLPIVNTGGAIYRAQKTAAIALKMRVYLNMGNWDSVLSVGNRLIPATLSTPNGTISLLGAHALTATPAAPFVASSLSAENLFSIKNDALDNGSVNGAMAQMYGSLDLGGRGMVCVSPIIWNNAGWLVDDLRRTTLYRTGTSAIGTAIMTVKYTDYVNRSDNTPIIRWAEVLLMQAEAEARKATTVSARGVALLNLVRNRSLAAPTTQAYTTASFATATDLVSAILLERRIEFLMEGRRWPDIHRTAMDPIVAIRPAGIPAKVPNGGITSITKFGIGVAVAATQVGIPYADYRFIWPLPSGEVTQNPIVVQNPGY